MEVEEALESLGKVGRWQATYFIVMSVCKNTMTAFHTLSIIWISHTPEHHCRVSQGVSINDSIPRDSNGKLSQCLKYVNLSLSNQTMACDDGWTYDPHDSYTIVNKWDLVCDNEFYSQMPQTILVVGLMVGAFVSSVISDKFGRKPVFMASQMGIVVVGVVCVFIENFQVFLFSRFITGLFLQGNGLSGFIIISEMFASKQRTFAGVIEKCFIGLFLGVLSLLAYLIPHWRHLQLAISLSGLFSVPLFWYLSESVPWLYTNGRVEEAEKAIRNAAKMNNIQMPDVILKRNNDHILKVEGGIIISVIKGMEQEFSNTKSSPQKKILTYSLLDLLKSRTLLLYLTVSSFICVFGTLVFFGLSLTSGVMGGNRFLNGFYNGIIEIPANIFAYILITIFGRKKPYFSLFVLSGISSLIVPFIPNTTPSGADLSYLPRIFSNSGKFFITGCFTITFLYIAELFPTNLRNRALGIAYFFGMTGSMSATFAKYLLIKYPTVPSLVFAVLSFLAALLVLILPETHKRPLPNTIEEVESWTRTVAVNKNPDQNETTLQETHL